MANLSTPSLFPRAASLLLVALGCGGCSGSSGGSALSQAESTITSFHFTASTTIPENPPPAVDALATDPGEARAVYDATIRLPTVAPGTYNCPADFGVSYHLAFYSGSSLVLQADADPSGCAAVHLTGEDVAREGGGSDYWQLVATALSIPESEIYPYVALPNPTSASALPACVYPINADNTDPVSGRGCQPSREYKIYTVPDGGTAEVDGAVVGPDGQPVASAGGDACPTADFSLTCTEGGDIDAGVPAPDPAFACTILPVPNPAGTLTYCCPCGQ